MPKAAKTHGTAATRGHGKSYDRWRGSSASRGYGHKWRKYRDVYLVNNPLCVECLKKGKLVPAKHVDHIKPVSGPDDPLFWDPENHQSLCHSCHSTKTAKENFLGCD